MSAVLGAEKELTLAQVNIAKRKDDAHAHVPKDEL